MTQRDDQFEVRLGRIRSRGGGQRPKSFVAQVLKASGQAGPPNHRTGNGGSARRPFSGASPFGRARGSFGRSRLFDAHRRVTVKARVVRQSGRGASRAPLSAHLSYLRREGVTRGRVLHVRFPGVEVFAEAPPTGGIVEIRMVAGKDGKTPYRIMSPRSDLDLAAQVKAPGATWLDHRMVERERMPLTPSGFGAEVQLAMQARTEHLAERGLASIQADGSVRHQRNLLATLRQQELEQVGAKVAAETGRPYEPSVPGNFVTGTFTKRLNLSSGRFAMVDNGLGFQLVPWAPSLEKQHGRHISGVARDDGGINWSHDRQRGLGL